MRRELADALHRRPAGLYIGSACGMVVGLVAVSGAHNPVLTAAGLTLVILSICRIFTGFGGAYLQNRLGDFLRRTYWIGALAFAANAGLAAGLSLYSETQHDLAILMVGFSLIFGSVIAIGNAGRPVIAICQLCLTTGPVIIGSLLHGSLPLLALAAILPAMTVGLAFVTLSINADLSNQVRTARESAQLAAMLHTQAQTDGVTGLANRAGLHANAPGIIAAAEPASIIAIFWLDLHRFKELNDAMGPQMGDKVLQEVAKRLAARAPSKALIARFRSDEFLMIGELADMHQVELLASALLSDIAAPMRLDGQRVETGAALGVETMKPDAALLETHLQHAGLALYHAKVAGQNQVRFFDHSMTRELIRKKEIEAELRLAIQRDELAIYFQPIYDLKTGRIHSFEALVRWFHPDKGELAPAEFIPVAEETGLIITLGNWITRQAALACASWPEHVTLAVNLSPVQIRAPGAALGILNALKDTGLHPSRLELEVTENLFLKDDAETTWFMERLASEGVRFALDDFGTGYSSLHYINKYPFRTIKVDRSFISGANIGKHSDAIIRAVAEMGSTLDMQIVAEGLETVEQLETVREAGCTLGQGYHFSRAVPAHAALVMLNDEVAGTAPCKMAG